MPQKSVYPQSTLEQTSNEQLAQESMSDIVERFETVAGEVSEDHEAIISAFDGTSGFGECPIAPDVLAKLLPDDKVVELPRLTRVSGGSLYRFAKRMFDVVACSVALAVLAVPMVVIAIMVKRQSSGPVIYAQMRVGKDGRPFKIYKFRSMYSDAEARGAQWAFGDDPRVTPIGHTLRKTRLDEVPQFWNVVKGDMSLIGPRPERPVFHEAFCKHIDGWEQRLVVRPGITGLAQVQGGYELLPREKVLLDIEYIENRSIAMDLFIVGKTVQTVITGKGAR